MSKVDVLSIVAHAGDAEVASGIALAHEVNAGKKVAMCHLTLGENPKSGYSLFGLSHSSGFRD